MKVNVSKKTLGVVGIVGAVASGVASILGFVFGGAQRENEIQNVVNAMPLEDRFDRYLATREKSPEETETENV